MANTAKVASIDSKKMLRELADNNVKIRFTQRKQVQLLKQTAFYHEGQIITPHITFADYLIKQKLAKAV